MTNPLTTYEREALGSLYAALDFMKCNDLDCCQVEAAIAFIEVKTKAAA